MNTRHLCLVAAMLVATVPASAADWAVDAARTSIKFSGV